MAKIKLSTERCKGCFLCMSVCPKGAISPAGVLGEKGYEIIKVDEEKCIQCGSCFRMCPDYVFDIE